MYLFPVKTVKSTDKLVIRMDQSFSLISSTKEKLNAQGIQQGDSVFHLVCGRARFVAKVSELNVLSPIT